MAAASSPPVIGVLPALVDGAQTTLCLRQLPLFVHVGSTHQLDSQAETLLLGQGQSVQHEGPGLLTDTAEEEGVI